AAALVAGCGETPAKVKLIDDAGTMGVARLAPKSGSTVRGFISFTQRGDRVEIAGTFVELMPGPHSVYIHSVGNCGSPSAASACPCPSPYPYARGCLTGEQNLTTGGRARGWHGYAIAKARHREGGAHAVTYVSDELRARVVKLASAFDSPPVQACGVTCDEVI